MNANPALQRAQRIEALSAENMRLRRERDELAAALRSIRDDAGHGSEASRCRVKARAALAKVAGDE